VAVLLSKIREQRRSVFRIVDRYVVAKEYVPCVCDAGCAYADRVPRSPMRDLEDTYLSHGLVQDTLVHHAPRRARTALIVTIVGIVTDDAVETLFIRFRNSDERTVCRRLGTRIIYGHVET
jgi:hypothetical protein